MIEGLTPARWSRFSTTAFRLIREALEAGAIRLVSEHVADKLRAYVPFWV